MMRSLYSGVSGLKNHQTRMDVIGNNIANVNTAGFKASRVVFQDIYSQNLAVASRGTPAVIGGTNPIQVGLGVKLAAVDTLFTASATQRSDNPTDLAIVGEGFFAINVGGKVPTAGGSWAMGEIQYTRAGNLYVDNSGNLIVADGNYVLGMRSVPNSITYTDSTGQVTITEFTDPLPTRPTPPPPLRDPADAAAVAAYKDAMDDYNDLMDTWVGDMTQWETDQKAWYTAAMTATVGGVIQSIGYADPPAKPTDDGVFSMDHLNVAGYTGINIDTYGQITGINEQTDVEEILGYITLATFTNNPGLEKTGGSMYKQTYNSGEAVYNRPNTGAAGHFDTGALEMSNVDLAAEFTDMIITQRGFQANSRVITTSDTLLEELINLKR